MIDAVADLVVTLASRAAVAILADVLAVGALVSLVIVAGSVPVVRDSPAGPFLADIERGARRLVVDPVSAAVYHGGPTPRAVGWLLVVAVLAVAAVPMLVRVPAALLVLWVAGRNRRERADAWWSHRRLVAALTAAGVLKAPKEGERPPSLSYRGPPRHTEHGTSVTVSLPAGRTLSDVLAKREALAGALRVPLARLEVTQHDDDDAGTVRLHLAHPGDSQDVPATVTTATATTWTDPVRIGRDTHGQPVDLVTVEANTVVAGIPGSGKTSLARVVLGHYLLDPTTTVYVLDGKGSAADYGTVRPLCERFVSGVDEGAVEDTVGMMAAVLDVVRARNASGDIDHPGVLVLLEELQDVRAAASKPQRDQLDSVLGRIVRMGRAVAVHVLVSTQRPSTDDLPSGTRNLVSQRLALMLRNPADAALVLGSTPTVTLPRRRGQALLATPAGTRAVLLDRLTDTAWAALVDRATALRAAPALAPAPAPAGPAERRTVNLRKAPRRVLDPVLGEVLRYLADADPSGVPAAEIHAALPQWARQYVPTPRALGIELRRHPGEVERVNRGSSRVWRLTEQCRSTVGALPGSVGGPPRAVSASVGAAPPAVSASVGAVSVPTLPDCRPTLTDTQPPPETPPMSPAVRLEGAPQ